MCLALDFDIGMRLNLMAAIKLLMLGRFHLLMFVASKLRAVSVSCMLESVGTYVSRCCLNECLFGFTSKVYTAMRKLLKIHL